MAQIVTRRLQANGLEFDVDEAGEGEDVALLLHGFPESRFSWRHQLPLLANLGWRAVAPDLRGYGGSSRPDGVAAYRSEALVEDVAGLFEALGPARRRLLIGHDWGAMIAWLFAIEARLPLDGLVIMNVPHPAVFAATLRRSWAQKAMSWYVAFFQLPWLPERLLGANHARAIGQAFVGSAMDKSRFPPEVTEVYRANAVAPGALTAMINYYRANARTLSAPGAARLIEVPTLMIWGDADTALHISNTEGYGPLVRDFTLRRLPGVSHWVQQEAPEQVNRLLAEWISGRLG